MLKVGQARLSIEDFEKVLYNEASIELDPVALGKVNASFSFLKEFSKDKLIYGINTGLGPMAQIKIEEADQKQLQYNLIRSHSAGTGSILQPIYIKSMMLARLNTLMQGYSGIHSDSVELLKEFINRDIYPLIFEHGGVGASGDLVQLAHLALGLIGEGEAWIDGQIESISKAFQKNNLTPLGIHLREGLALINGTSAMSGIGIVNLILAKRLLSWSVIASSMINELVETFDDHFSEGLNKVKLHNGQNEIASSMRAVLKDSKLVKNRMESLYSRKVNETVIKEKVQEYYSLRCVPQILGPVYDALEICGETLMNEVNSANDNPIIDVETGNVYHGGNFHGDYISFEMDKLKIALTKLSMLAERQVNFLMNNKLNEKLPPFVNLGKLGLNLGLQGVQFAAVSTVAENQMLSNPMYVHSIPNNNDNQDIVSMGANAAQITMKVVENSFEVMAVEFMALLQGVEYLGIEDKLSPYNREVYSGLRKVFPAFIEDTPRYHDVKAVKDYLLKTKIVLPQ